MVSGKATRWLVLLLSWVAFLVRVAGLTGQSLWRDEVDTIRFSGWPLAELVGGLFRTGHNGPLYFLLMRFWRTLAGNSEFAIRYPSAAAGVLAVAVGYRLARQLGLRRGTGLLLSLLLATSPYLIWYGQEAKMYALLLVLVMAAFIAYHQALLGGRWGRWAVFVGLTSLSFYIHLLSPLMLPVYGAFALLHPGRWRRHWRGWLTSMLLLIAPYLPLAMWQMPLLIEKFHSGHPFYPLREEILILLRLYTNGLARFAELPLISLYLFLLLGGVFAARPPRRLRLSLAAWLLLPPLAVYLISLRVAVFEDRYLIYIAPAFYLLVALGLGWLGRYSRLLAGLCLGVILVMNLAGLWQQQQAPIKADMRAAAAYLAARPEPPRTIMIQIPYLQYTFDYYYPGEYTFIEGLWTNDGKTPETVEAEMTARLAGVDDLWLIVSEEPMWDSRGLARRWLNEHGRLMEEAHFKRVDVYRYRLELELELELE